MSVESHQYLSAINNLFLDTLDDNNLDQVVDFATRGSNLLDILITNRPTLLNSCKPCPGISDHDTIIFASIDCAAKIARPQARKIFMWNKADISKLKTYVKNKVSEFCSKFNSTVPVETLWHEIKSIINNAEQNFVPSKWSSTRYSQPWVTRKIRKLSRQKQRAHKQYQRSQCRGTRERYNSLKSECQRECRRAYNEYVRDKICPVDNQNSKHLWTFVKSLRCDNNGVAPLSANGISHSDEKTKANILNKQFASVFSRDDGDPFNLGQSPYPKIENITIGCQGIRKILHQLKPKKASGPDNIQARFLKETADELAPAISTLFQASLDQSKIPNDWRHANVAPVFKKGDRSKPSNYRPISLTSICCKALEHVVHSHVLTHLEKHKILTDYQHGFRKKRSCETQLILTVNDLARGLNAGKQIDLILLDFSKAFDKVSHKKLLAKLKFYGIEGSCLGWVSDFLANRTQTVVLNGRESDSVGVISGVPQGTVLGPLLFLAYINDLPDCVTSTARLFADDSALYRVIDSAADAQSLQGDLDRLQLWEAKWSMEFNPDKCEVIRITNKHRVINATYAIHGKVLNRVDVVKYLGVNIHAKLNWSVHVNTVVKRANSTRAFLQRNLRGCPEPVKSRCYTTYVRPTLEYSASVWDPIGTGNKGLRGKLEGAQNKCARWVTGDWRRKSSVSKMCLRLHWLSLQERRAQMRIKMIHKIVHNHVDFPIEPYLTASPHQHDTRGAHVKYEIPRSRVDVFQNTFFPHAIGMWNVIPAGITAVKDLEVFRAGMEAVRLTR